MQAGTQVDPEHSQPIDDIQRAPNAPRRAVEGREEAVSDGLYLTSAKALEALSDDPVVALEHVAPAAVTEGPGPAGGNDGGGGEAGGRRPDRVPERARRPPAIFHLLP